MSEPVVTGLMLSLTGVACVLLLLACNTARLFGASTQRAKVITRFAREALSIVAYAGLILFYISHSKANDIVFAGALSLALIAFIGETVNLVQRLTGSRVTGGKFFLSAGAFSCIMMILTL